MKILVFLSMFLLGCSIHLNRQPQVLTSNLPDVFDHPNMLGSGPDHSVKPTIRSLAAPCSSK